MPFWNEWAFRFNRALVFVFCSFKVERRLSFFQVELPRLKGEDLLQLCALCFSSHRRSIAGDVPLSARSYVACISNHRKDKKNTKVIKKRVLKKQARKARAEHLVTEIIPGVFHMDTEEVTDYFEERDVPQILLQGPNRLIDSHLIVKSGPS